MTTDALTTEAVIQQIEKWLAQYENGYAAFPSPHDAAVVLRAALAQLRAQGTSQTEATDS